MPRKRRPGALDELVQAALVVFARAGFRQAQVVDVAREMGVAPGTVYSYVASKEALFGLVIERAFVSDPLRDVQLPVLTPAPDELLERARRRIEQLTRLPVLTAAHRGRDAGPPGLELREVLEEIWDLTLKTRLAADMVERSARDWPALSDLFFLQVRKDLFSRLQAYFEQQVCKGRFRSAGDPGVIARTALESVTFWARHRYRDPAGLGISDVEARRTVLSFLVDGIVGSERA